MKYLRPALVFSAAAALAIVLIGSTGDSSADGGLESQVASLTDRVAALESQLASLTRKVNGNHPDARTEQLAAAEFSNINTLIQAGKMEEAKPKLAAFMEEYGGTRAGRQAASINQEIQVVGKPAPGEWQIDEWFQGEDKVDLDSGDPTIVVFWETWCPHCRREVPKLQQTWETYRDRGLQVIGLSKLSRGTNESSIRQFIEEHDLEFPMAKESGGLSSHFGVSGIPAVAVVKDNKVVWRGHPARLSTSMIDAWLQ